MFDNAERKTERLRNRVEDSMSVRTYNIMLGLMILYGLVANVVIVAFSGDFFINMNPVVFLIGYFVMALLGCALACGSDSPAVSFIGYNFVVLPIGALLSIFLTGYEEIDILAAIVITAIVVAVMLFIAIIWPYLFNEIGRSLFIGLLVGLVAECVATFLFDYSGDIFNWFFVILFSVYIGYDWCKAQDYSKTLDNAIDSALDIYLDIINIFIRILSIIGNKN